MVRGRPMTPVVLSEQTREQLESMTRSRSLSHGLVRRAEIVLLAADGWASQDIAQALKVNPATVGKWRRRFLDQGLNGLYDEVRPGAPRTVADEQVAEIVYKALNSKPAEQTQWSVRLMADETGVSKATRPTCARSRPYNRSSMRWSASPPTQSHTRSGGRIPSELPAPEPLGSTALVVP